MGHAYTPGLKVSAAAECVRSRLLPIRGDVLVRVGDDVGPQTVVARAMLPGNVVSMTLSRTLGVAPADLPELLLVKEGSTVVKDQPVARSKGIFGLMRQTAYAPASGVLESVSKVSGQALFREVPLPVEVKAYVAGTITRVTEGFGVEVTARGAMVQGIFGIGPEVHGSVAVACTDPARPMRPDDILARHRGMVLVGGAVADLAVLRRCIELGVAALVTGGIDAADLKELLGFDLGVAITGQETVGVTVVITEGFGPLAMSARTHRLLSANEGRIASVSGATQIRAGVLRPEVLIPADIAHIEVTAVDSGRLALQSVVRIIRDPHFGVIGSVSALPPEPAMLDTEAEVRIVTVTIPGGQRVTLPRANVELVDERA